MKEKLLATALSATLLFAGSLRTANAETSAFRDALRPDGHGRSATSRANEDVILAVSNPRRNCCKRER
ncbi:hypothetical protein [Bradyrhizobium genosp. P]|uniref:hypothetical protein n=1 Tax=Bradyrhizobium genosp. P TaxID=83641 RepID=UPI003CFA2B1A